MGHETKLPFKQGKQAREVAPVKAMMNEGDEAIKKTQGLLKDALGRS